ncbi:MAG: hypothetical protein OEU54_01625 [Gemmatimonadota bacterium]|nr:hypothetical protein [Gemmatimonadota bacterium]
MKPRAVIPLLALVVACSGDPGALGPEESPAGPASVSNPAQGGSSFIAVMSFIQTIDPGLTQITPGNVLHTTGLVNEFALSGDLEGLAYFSGDFHNVLRTGNGPIVGGIFFEISAPGVGSFDCQTSASILRDFGTPDVTATGKISRCVGTGDYDGMGMKGTFSLRPDASTWDVEGTIF